MIPDAYVGSEPTPGLAPGSASEQVTCSRELLDAAIGTNTSLTQANAPLVVQALIEGGQPSAADEIRFPQAASGEGSVTRGERQVGCLMFALTLSGALPPSLPTYVVFGAPALMRCGSALGFAAASLTRAIE